MEQKLNDTLIARIKNSEVPEDLKNFECPAIPLGNSVFITEMLNGTRKTAGGLILTESKQTQGTVGRISALGPECKPYLKVGLKVIYSSFANLEIIIAGQNYLLLNDLQIYAILPEESAVNMAPETLKQARTAKKQKELVETMKRISSLNKNREDMFEEKAKKTIKKQPRRK